jgi:hypothetical protein
MNAPRLLKLARFLEKLPARKFDFASVVSRARNGCGSVCCAVGWLPAVFPKLAKWEDRGFGVSLRDDYHTNFGAAEVIFDIGCIAATDLFCPERLRDWADQSVLPEKATPKEVAASIRAFVKWRRAQ